MRNAITPISGRTKGDLMEIDVADLRAEIARQRKSRYEVAALVGLHPNYFGKMLNEKLPMPLSVWERACEALGMGAGVRAV